MGTTLQCDRSREWISVELDGQLSEFESALLSRHLARCRECRRFGADVRAATAALRAAEAEEPTRPLGLPARRRARPGMLPRVAAVVGAAAMAAFAVVGIGQSLRRTPGVQSPTVRAGSEIQDMLEIRRQELRPHASARNPRVRVTVVG